MFQSQIFVSDQKNIEMVVSSTCFLCRVVLGGLSLVVPRLRIALSIVCETLSSSRQALHLALVGTNETWPIAAEDPASVTRLEFAPPWLAPAHTRQH